MGRLLELYPWLGLLSDEERAALLARIDRLGLWGACFSLGIYERCRQACRAAERCVPIDGWRACLDANGNDEPACRLLCPRQPGCEVPSKPCPVPPNSVDLPVCVQGAKPEWRESTCGWVCPPFPCPGRPNTPPLCPQGQAEWVPWSCDYVCPPPAPCDPPLTEPTCEEGKSPKWDKSACRYVCVPCVAPAVVPRCPYGKPTWDSRSCAHVCPEHPNCARPGEVIEIDTCGPDERVIQAPDRPCCGGASTSCRIVGKPGVPCSRCEPGEVLEHPCSR